MEVQQKRMFVEQMEAKRSRSVAVIGAGISGLAAASVLAQHGYRVSVFDRHEEVGGRARTWRQDGFTFDMGPSFYWMPDVFERFFARFGTSAGRFYSLKRLDPSYTVVFNKDDRWPMPAGRAAVKALFEREESGAARRLDAFLDEAALKYRVGMQHMVYKPSLSWGEYMEPNVLAGLLRTSVLSSLRRHVRGHFRSPRIRRVMEFPVLFLGAMPQHTPALYSLMNHADIDLGTWYPMGGMGRVMQAMQRLAEEQGVVFHLGEEVERIVVQEGRAKGLRTSKGVHGADAVLASADYHHVEQDLLGDGQRGYSPAFWEKRTMAPSTLLFYVGLDTRLPSADHHMLFFDEDLDAHGEDIYTHRRWPRKPLFYLSCTSVTDPSTAPAGCENLVVLIPIASGAVDDDATRERYFDLVAERLLRYTGIDIRRHLRVKRSYCVRDLEQDHHAFRGNAYGLASTLAQTGPLRPRIKSRRVKGLYFAGQLSVPGPGLPPALISGQVAADLINREITSR